jgi:hypothetical protein
MSGAQTFEGPRVTQQGSRPQAGPCVRSLLISSTIGSRPIDALWLFFWLPSQTREPFLRTGDLEHAQANTRRLICRLRSGQRCTGCRPQSGPSVRNLLIISTISLQHVGALWLPLRSFWLSSPDKSAPFKDRQLGVCRLTFSD